MKHVVQAISALPTTGRVVVDISGERASVPQSEFITPTTGDARYLQLAGGTLTGLLTTNGQIAFPATQNPSSNANTLDDYEEGTFTPVIAGGTTAGVGTYTAQNGTYTKIGNIVFFWITLVWTAHTGTGQFLVNGLPFAVNGIGRPATIEPVNIPLSANSIATAFVTGSQVQMRQVALSTSALSTLPIDTDGGNLRITGSYPTT